MNNVFPYLKDREFLRILDYHRNKRQLLRIVILDEKERPIDDFCGYSKPGTSLTVDSSSPIRRTCDIVIAADVSSLDYIKQLVTLININRKVQIYVGFENNLKEKFPEYKNFDKIWIPQGVFVIQNPTFSHTVSEYTISLQLQDKMCLLNGSCGGVIPSTTTLDRVETYVPEMEEIFTFTTKDGKEVFKYEVFDKETEEYSVIYMEDKNLDDLDLEIWQDNKIIDSKGNLYETYYKPEDVSKRGLSRRSTGRMILSNNSVLPISEVIRELVNHWGGEQLSKIIINIPQMSRQLIKWEDKKLNLVLKEKKGKSIQNKYYYIGDAVAADEDYDFTVGDLIALEEIDLVYPSVEGFTVQGNSTVADALNNIVSQLGGNYEFFYDCYGNFVFQEIKNYLNTSQSTDVLNILKNNFIDNSYLLDKTRNTWIYDLEKGFIVSSFNNVPNYDLIKNDFIIEGSKNELPIKYHVAIEEPKQFNGTFGTSKDYFLAIPTIDIQGTNTENINHSLALTKPYIPSTPGLLDIFYYDSGNNIIYKWDGQKYYNILEELEKESLNVAGYHIYKGPINVQNDWRTCIYLNGVVNENEGIKVDFYEELKVEWPKIIDIKALCEGNKEYYKDLKPEEIRYFLDFLRTADPINQFSISNIGRRTMVETDDDINCLFTSDYPLYMLIKTNYSRQQLIDMDDIEDTELILKIESVYQQGYKPMLLSYEDSKNATAAGFIKSAYDYAKELIYQNTSLQEEITLDILPIYYLDVNQRIKVDDFLSNISGEYLIKNINFPLDGSGTMGLTCSRVLNRV